MALIETLRNELMDAFDMSIGLEENEEVRVYANANGLFFYVTEDKNAPLAIVLGGTPAKLLYTYEAYPESKYLDYWKKELGGTGTFTDDDFDNVLFALDSEASEDLDYTIYDTLYAYEQFMLDHGHVLRVYVVSFEVENYIWVEFYPSMEKAMERVNVSLANEHHKLAQRLKEAHMNITDMEYGVESDKDDFIELIHRDEKLAIRWVTPEHMDNVLKVNPYEVDSGKSYNAFTIKLCEDKADEKTDTE